MAASGPLALVLVFTSLPQNNILKDLNMDENHLFLAPLSPILLLNVQTNVYNAQAAESMLPLQNLRIRPQSSLLDLDELIC
ncbi:hypothetical protein HKD37_02G004039 [Glycine soja]|uniref:Uncharacterized protein n=2 Tax=Glycine subgen. Soja TaxID=1462606 RepID=A0A0R0L1E9_SOYBN|nr:hypothetical protein JHK85_004085 [Glycine max]KAH1059994.1 hypothetical protein GYH30_003803 [Glycine max]KAH1261234.1 hypothetical protein GmHk_02G004141 [Glycine max]RZC24641.1 hypothetical protein D0Y65_003714 [Glycine soja]